jgi:hypothetical protein
VRIRSIKPEFWRSSDIARLSIEDRLLFIGLWSYVDDNGVGIDKLAAIAADLFADDIERDSSETFARVSRGLRNLSATGRIIRYTIEGAQYLSITNWGKHQRIDKPGKARFPHHDAENAEIRDTLARVSESVAPGTGEQGNRGTGEQAVVPLRNYVTERGNELSKRATITTGANIINQFNDHIPETLPSKTRQDLTAHVTVALQDGIAETHIRRGIELWYSKALGPGALPGFIFEAQREANGNIGAVKPRQATGTERAIAGLELARQYQEQEANAEE